jgi:AraC family transcriptional regulator
MEATRLDIPFPTQDRHINPSPLLAIAPGPTRVMYSSEDRAWKGLLLEKHLSAPGYRAAGSTDRNIISMITGSPARFEHRGVSGHFVEYVNRAGTLMVTPSGKVPELRLQTPSEFVHCALDREFTAGIAEELEKHDALEPTFHPGFQDKSIRRILVLLTEELVTDRPLGRLFVDSLAHALATRYLMLDSAPDPRKRSEVSRLPARILRRVQDMMEANLDADLSLNALAAESGYSRAHFLRMFRAATGLTPHQYVLELRIRRAQEYLQREDASIIDVAVSCGFSSQSHMTTVFRQRLEMTPSEFRRTA